MKTVKSVATSSDKQLSVAEEMIKNENEFETSPAPIIEYIDIV